jgi:HD-GYP domain-containing protein (c-di-GMP phosphodiesterase class II)/predicted hydrocarbon binding protein
MFVKQRYHHIDKAELLAYAGMDEYEVADEGHWFSQNQANRFYHKLVELTGNKNIAREAGRFAASPEVMGAVRQQTLGMLNLTHIFAKLGKVYENVSKSTVYQSRKISNNRVEITITPKPGVKEGPQQCENRMGMFEAIVLEHTNKLPEIEQTECVFKGGSCCQYVVSWDISRAILLSRARNISILASILILFTTHAVFPGMFISLFIACCVLLFTLETTHNFYKEKELKKGMAFLMDASDRLVEQLEINYNNAQMTNEVGSTITKNTNIEDILESVIQISKKRLNYDRGMIYMADASKKRLVFRAGYGIQSDQLQGLEKLEFRLNNMNSKGMFVVSFRDQKPFLVTDIDNLNNDLSTKSVDFAKKMESTSFLCCPIICDNESIGVFVVDNKSSKRKLVESDISLLMGITSIIGISIRNAQLITTAEERFTSILKVMAASIDAMDPLTAGHSEKVTEYSVGICRQMCLKEEETDVIQMAAALHDYGKIGIPDALLTKPGRLAPDEYEAIKVHATKTFEILEQVNFSGSYSAVPLIASSHHEKMDGSGYPLGLAGDEIPLGARIIAVADFFEAITAVRHYREPMPLDVAFGLLYKERGIHFDASVVDAFVQYFETEHPELYQREVVERYKSA